MHTDGGNVFEIFLRLPVLEKSVHNSDFRWGKVPYIIYQRVLSHDFLITLENGNIDGGGGECNFSLTILKENCF